MWKNVAIHSMGGLGRTGTLDACILVLNGFTVDETIKTRRMYRKEVIEARVQEQFIMKFEQLTLLKKKNGSFLLGSEK